MYELLIQQYSQNHQTSLQKSSFTFVAPQGFLGSWGEGLFIFRELGSTANYFRGAGEQAHNFGDLGSTAKKKKNINIRLPFDLILRNVAGFWGLLPQDPHISM